MARNGSDPSRMLPIATRFTPSRSGQPIAGLYAVGNDAASVMGGTYPGGGITPGPAMTFGYIAGQHLAARRDNENRSEKYEVASPAPVREGVGA